MPDWIVAMLTSILLGTFDYSFLGCLLWPSKVTASLIFTRVFRRKAFPATNIKNEERHKNAQPWNAKACRGACAVPMLLVDISSKVTFLSVSEVHLAFLISFTQLDKQNTWGNLCSTDMISPGKCKGYLGKWINEVNEQPLYHSSRFWESKYPWRIWFAVCFLSLHTIGNVQERLFIFIVFTFMYCYWLTERDLHPGILNCGTLYQGWPSHIHTQVFLNSGTHTQMQNMASNPEKSLTVKHRNHS